MDTKFKEIASGIDISKSTIDVAVMNFNGTVAYKEFSNDIEGAKLSLKLLLEHNCTEVAMESTGPYWYGIYDYLSANGINAILVNPSKAKSHLVANKTDKLDSTRLATLHLLNQLKDNKSYVPDKDIRRLRRFARFRANLVDMKTAIKNSTSASISTYSYGMTSIFSDTFGRAGKRFLNVLVQAKDQEELAKELGKLKLTEERRNKIIEAASKSFSPTLDPWLIQKSSEMISEIESWIVELDDAIAKAVELIPRVKEYVNRLLTIKGVGLDTAQMIAAEIADIERFKSSGSLVRYSGINPKVIQSGSVIRYDRLEKGGPPYLRRALYQAAETMDFFGPQNFQRHYQAVKARYGKKAGHVVGTVSTSRKLVRLIWSMLANRSDFTDSPQKLTARKQNALKNRVKRFDAKSSTKEDDESSNNTPMIKLLLNLPKMNPEVGVQVKQLLEKL
ncbi:MAG: IS110 family transposase [Nitrososphaerota archaeon]|nr:IS110 family transposase [Nitrososphaerota archaeon]